MAPATVDDDDDGQGNSSLQSEEEELSYSVSSSQDDDSDCSVTSGFEGHLQQVSNVDKETADILQAAESAETTWTDEMHSSYLDSMEATFVRKMYDKEYCSLDVCGHSSHSSMTWEPECVESQPLCLNMRKPSEQKVAGLLALHSFAKPFSLMLSSPWIQHFKSKRNTEVMKTKGGHDDEAANAGTSEGVMKSSKLASALASLNRGSVRGSDDLTPKKRGGVLSLSDIRQQNPPGGFKKLKCHLSVLSHMDMLMEEQYNAKHGSTPLGSNSHLEDGPEEQPASHLDRVQDIKPSDEVALVDLKGNRKRGELEIRNIIGSSAILINQPKLDQVVPSSQSTENGEECGAQSISSDPGAEDLLCSTPTECAVVSTRLGSQTWTWGDQGPRCQLHGKHTS